MMIDKFIAYLVAFTCAQTIILCERERCPSYLTEFTVACAGLQVMFMVMRSLG